MRQPSTGEEVAIGIVGADEIVHRVMSVAREFGNRSWRLIAAVYEDERDAYRQAMKIAPRVDVCMFAGPLPYDIATRHGDLPVPATYVPVGGAALYGTLLRGQIEGIFDPLRVSVDSLSPNDVYSAYREVGLDTTGVRVKQYVEPESAGHFLDFHRDLYRSGETTGAVTTVPTVAAALTEAGVPSLKMTASGLTLLHAVQTAALIGSGAKLEESRIVTMIVRVPRSAVPAHVSPSDYWYQELKLSLHRELLREARPMDAAVLVRDEQSYLIVTTMGSLNVATDDLAVAPFVGRISNEFKINLDIGIGLGRSAREAELNAESAVDKASAGPSGTAYLVGPDGVVLQLPTAHGAATPGTVAGPATSKTKSLDVLARLRESLGNGASETGGVVDAERVAEVLGVTLRTARRTLNSLVDEGLAWPLPPGRSSKAGRPPRPYQLLLEKLPPVTASH